MVRVALASIRSATLLTLYLLISSVFHGPLCTVCHEALRTGPQPFFLFFLFFIFFI